MSGPAQGGDDLTGQSEHLGSDIVDLSMSTSISANISTRRAVPVQERARETFERLVGVGSKHAVEVGLGAMSVRDVIEAADVSKGAFYNYFNGVDELIAEIRRRVRLDYLTYLADFFASVKPRSVESILLELAGWYAGYLRRDPLAKRLFLERGSEQGSGPLEGPDWGERRPWCAMIGYLDAAGLLKRPVDDELSQWAEIIYCQFEVILDLAFRRDPNGDPATLRKLEQVIAKQVEFLTCDSAA